MADPRCMVVGQRGFGTRPVVQSPIQRQHVPHNTPLNILAGYCSRCAAEGHRRLPFSPANGLPRHRRQHDLEVLDPRSCSNYGSQPSIEHIIDIENHNSNALASRFGASSKGAYGRLWAMVGVVGRWMCVGGRDGCKMEAGDEGRTGHPDEFSDPKSNKLDIFLGVVRNW